MVSITKTYERVKPAALDFGEERIDRRLTELLKEKPITGEDFWDSINSYVLQTIKKIVEGCLEEEAGLMTGARYYEHSPVRKAKRSGYYMRRLITKYGLIEGILVPKLRKKKYKQGFKVLKRYARRVEDIDGLVRELFLAGVSSRRVEK